MNMSNAMVPPFQLLGPSKNPYPGTICLPQVPLPAGANVKSGDLATIQVVELAAHGASLFSVRSISSEYGQNHIVYPLQVASGGNPAMSYSAT